MPGFSGFCVEAGLAVWSSRVSEESDRVLIEAGILVVFLPFSSFSFSLSTTNEMPDETGLVLSGVKSAKRSRYCCKIERDLDQTRF